jgi:hypothetical protein
MHGGGVKRGGGNAKGKKGEREAAKAWAAATGLEARRGRQYSGLEGKDVALEAPGIHLEVKRVEALSLYPAVEQAARDAAEGEVPVVLHRRNRKPWLVVVRLDDLRTLAERLLEHDIDEIAKSAYEGY